MLQIHPRAEPPLPMSAMSISASAGIPRGAAAATGFGVVSVPAAQCLAGSRPLA